MRIVTTGGKIGDPWAAVRQTLDAYEHVRTRLLVAHLGGPGVDALVTGWCGTNRVPCVSFSTNHHSMLTVSARARDMLLTIDPHLVIAFVPGGEATNLVLQHAKDKGFKILEVPWMSLTPSM